MTELKQAEILRAAICQTLTQISTLTAQPSMPCSQSIPGPSQCHAFSRPDVRVILVYVSEAARGIAPTMPSWFRRPSAGSWDAVVPVVAEGSDPGNLLPPALLKHHVKFIHSDIAEAVPDILASAGVTSDEFRIFISYRWQEAAAMADQLFDELAHANFDVFLDRFRQAPGIDFALRINEALADMAFVLVVETPNINRSEWIDFEIAYARNNHLGLLALQPPGGTALPQIDPLQRITLVASDVTGTGTNNRLTPQACTHVVQRIRVDHGRALAERQRYVRVNMRDALLYWGAGSVDQGSSGLLHVSGGKTHYGIRMTARPPALGDFQDCDIAARSGDIRVVGGPTVQLRRLRQSRMEWLAQRTSVKLFDEADTADIAHDIVRGTL